MTRVTVLVDSDEGCGYKSEWGLSLHIQRDSTSVLLDFGQSGAFAQNAAVLGVDLASVDCAVLSHAHYDHADGMEAFFEHNTHAPLYLSAACAENCWSTKGGTTAPHYIGIREGLLARFAARLSFVPTNHPTTIAPGIHVVPHTTHGLAEKGTRDGMLLRAEDGWHADDFAHEISLVVELGNEKDAPLAILNSCSHAGPEAIAQEVAAVFPRRKFDAFVGGLHLFQSSDEAILHVADALRNAGVSHVYTGHCTGEHACELLAQELPGRLTFLRPGLVFDL